MQQRLMNAIEQQIVFLENNAPPEEQKSVHMEILIALKQARSGNSALLEKHRLSIFKLTEMLRGPLLTREMVEEKKLQVAELNSAYKAAFENKPLQKSIRAAEDAISQPALNSTIYLLKVLSPVVSLMNEAEGDE